MKYLTCIRGTSSVISAEEDASSNAGTPELGRISCGMTDGSCTTVDICWIEKPMSDVRLNQKKKMVILPELVRQLLSLFWKAVVESSLKIQMSDEYWRMVDGRVKYLNYWRCLKSSFLDVFLICIFGSYILKCRTM